MNLNNYANINNTKHMITSTATMAPYNIINYVIAGHAGQSFGFYSTPGKRTHMIPPGFYEGVNNRRIADVIKNILLNNGRLCETNTNCIFDTSIKTKAKFFKKMTNFLKGKNQEPLIIEVHTNAAGNGRKWHEANGLVIWTDKQSYKLAQIMSEELWATGLWRTNRGVKVCGWFRGKFKKMLGMMTGTPCKSILLELGFHTNLRDVQMLNKIDTPLIIGQAVERGLQRWDQIR